MCERTARHLFPFCRIENLLGFWLHRGQDPPLPRVQRLLAAAARKEIDGGLVPIENFDETLRDLVRLLPELDTTVLDEVLARRASSSAVWNAASSRWSTMYCATSF